MYFFTNKLLFEILLEFNYSGLGLTALNAKSQPMEDEWMMVVGGKARNAI